MNVHPVRRDEAVAAVVEAHKKHKQDLLRDLASKAVAEMHEKTVPRPYTRRMAKRLGQECSRELFRNMLLTRLGITETERRTRMRSLTGRAVGHKDDIPVAKLSAVCAMVKAAAKIEKLLTP